MGANRIGIVELAYERFGSKLGEYILWEETCFPMSDDIAMDQLKSIIAKADRAESGEASKVQHP